MHCRCGQKSAFALNELVVVIAILAVLAATLFPVFSRAREKARQTSCISNLKQLGLATLMYAQDYDECFPISIYPAGSLLVTFYDELGPYTKNVQIYQCPSAPHALLVDWLSAALGGFAPATPGLWTSYMFNYRVFNGGENNPIVDTRPVLSLRDVQFPNKTIMCFDGNLEYQPHTFNSPILARHNETADVNYVDGHAKAIKCEKNGVTFTAFDGSTQDEWVIQQGLYAGSYEGWGVPGL